MSWMAKLYETYDHIVDLCEEDGLTEPWPISHFVKNAHIEVVLDTNSNYVKGQTKILDSVDCATLIPATESSAGRAGAKIAPHPLCDELGYCASDRPNAKEEKVKAYLEQLSKWANEDVSNEKLNTIFKYLTRNTLWEDLSDDFEFPLKVKKQDGSSQKIEAEKVFIRWRVISPGDVITGTWEDPNLINSWIEFDKKHNSTEGLCYILGNNVRSASNHPRFLRRPGDGAKLVSSNDSSGYTFLGRFTDKTGAQAANVGFDVTQKAHNALRWLIARQGVKIGQSRDAAGAVVLAWAVSSKQIPQPLEDTYSLLNMDFSETMESPVLEELPVDNAINLGHTFAAYLRKYMAGYQAKFDATDSIIIMGLDSATPGRMAVTYYQELFPQQYIDQISRWHEDFAWYQRHTQDKATVWPISAPAPRSIWEAVYGITVSDSLKKSTIERILPCIIEARPFPRDLVSKAIQRASNRSIKRLSDQYSNSKSERAAWERHLGVACSLYRGFSKRNPNQKKEYEMALEENNHSRDYLYGRLLAIAEKIEEMAMFVAKEKVRSTHASRLMQRFSDHPFLTWKTIEEGINPYQQRLKNNIAPLESAYKRLLDDVCYKFEGGDFKKSEKLSGEYLLSYHLQRKWLRDHKLDKGQWLLKEANENDDLQTEGEE